MVPFIPHASASLAASDSSSNHDSAANVTGSEPFGLAMNRALAKNPDRPKLEPSKQQPASRPLRQKTAGRPSTNLPTSSCEVISTGTVRPSEDSIERSSARPRGSTDERDSSTSTELRVRSAPAADIGLLQALAAAAPTLPVLLDSATINLGTASSGGHSCSNGVEADPAAAISEVVTDQGDLTAHPEALALETVALLNSRNPASIAGEAPSHMGTPIESVVHGDDAANSPISTSVTADSPESTTASTDGSALPVASDPAIVSDRDAPKVKIPASFTNGPPSAATGSESPPSLGTSAAKQEVSMKKPEKVQKSADLAQQNLPGEVALTASQAELRTALLHSNSSGGSERLAAQADNNATDSLTMSPTSTSAAGSTHSTGDARLLSLEKTHDLVASHALRLSHSEGNESLRVVIEPGGGTRLSLELRLHNGEIEAQALLHRGDYDFLNSHWAELQQRLEQRGVHLAALECSAQSTTEQRQSHQPSQQGNDEPPTRSAFAEFAFDGSMEDSPAARRGRSKTYKGWETWA